MLRDLRRRASRRTSHVALVQADLRAARSSTTAISPCPSLPPTIRNQSSGIPSASVMTPSASLFMYSPTGSASVIEVGRAPELAPTASR